MNIMLDLFSGTGSVGDVFRGAGWVVVSLDRDLPADMQTDVLDWDYRKAYQPKHFQFIWASPPCTEYSIAKTVGVRKLAEANEIVKRTIEIINYFEPPFYVIENPQTGLLRKQSFMEGLPFKDVDYCKYGMPYRKRTRLWNNILPWTPRALCLKDCGNIEGRRHKETAQHYTHTGRNEKKKSHTTKQLYALPSELVDEIRSVVENSLVFT
jgi:hypothetical protein